MTTPSTGSPGAVTAIRVTASAQGPEAGKLKSQLAERARRFQEVRQPNREAALAFFQGLTELDQLTGNAREAHLERLCNLLVRAGGYTEEEVAVGTRTAGRWSNLQNLASDVISAVPQGVGAVMLGLEASPLSRAWTNFALAFTTLVTTPYLGKYYIQPMLEIQRLTRPLTSVNYGKSADPGPAYAAMRTETRAMERLNRQTQAGNSTVSATQLAIQRQALETAEQSYVNARSNLIQRRRLNQPESNVRMGRAVGFAATGWINFGVKLHQPDTRVPVVFILQCAIVAAVWAIHWFLAGASRDKRLRDEQLKVDIAAGGPRMVMDLVARQTGQRPDQLTPASVTSVDDEAIASVQAMIKDRKAAEENAAKTLFQAQRTPHLNEMSRLLGLTLPEVTQYYAPGEASVDSKDPAQRTDEETQLAARVAVQVQRLGAPDSPQRQRHQEHLRALRSIDQDVARLEHPDQWGDIDPDRQRALSAVLAGPPTSVSVAQVWQYLFKGTTSADDIVRGAHLLAKDIRTDWRRNAPDLHYKLGKATQVALMGSSTFPFLINNVIAILEAYEYHVPLVGGKIAATVVPLCIYFLGERYSGELVNEVVAMRNRMLAQYPFGRPLTWGRMGTDLAMFGSNFFLVPKAAYQDVTRAWGHRQARQAIGAARIAQPPLEQP